MRPLCIVCNKNVTGKLQSGNYRKKCRACGSKNGRATGDFKYRAYKKPVCENDTCPLKGWTYPSYVLDVHHITGNKNDHSEEQLFTLCKICHSVITYEQRHNVNTKYRSLND